MNPPNLTSLNRGATRADTTRLTRALGRRRRLLIAAVSALSSVAATMLPLSATLAADGVVSNATGDSVEAATPAEEPEVPATPDPAPPAAEPDPCAEALAWVSDAGLPLPPGVGYHCPSTQFSHHGAACWNGSPCRGSAFIAINVELMGSPTPEYLRHVVAHEVCHILDFQSTGVTTEAGADACAAAHGAG